MLCAPVSYRSLGIWSWEEEEEEEGAEPANSNRPEAGQVCLMPRANLPVPCLSFQAKHVNFPWGHQHPAAVKSFAILPP
jgi:hypothetical protein